jgi:diaminopimelate epimerase
VTAAEGLWKVEGAGNDFLLGIGPWADRLACEPELTTTLCRRRRGIGADGTLALTVEGPRRVRLIHRNRDGGRAAFCANGTRCAALAAHRLLATGDQLTVVADWRDVPALVGGDGVALDLPTPGERPRALELACGDTIWEGTLIAFGVPHLLIATRDPAAIDLAALGPTLRHHPDLAPDGANVSFVGGRPGGAITIRTWERGVEAETLCCGSAVVAAGWLEIMRAPRAEVRCLTASGEELVVADRGDAGLRLTGPARIVAEVRPDPSWI